MSKLRDWIAIIVLFSICLLAIYQIMEILAITTVILIGIVVYRNFVVGLLDVGVEKLQRSRTTKIGDIELTSDEKGQTTYIPNDRHPEWVRMTLSDITAEQVALLVVMYMQGKINARDKSNLRVLRSRGLIIHNKRTMRESSEAWLTDLGKQIATHLVDVNQQSTGTQAGEQIADESPSLRS
jgi:hypothetical protein